MPIDRDFLHEYAKNPQVQQAASHTAAGSRSPLTASVLKNTSEAPEHQIPGPHIKTARDGTISHDRKTRKLL
jgi:hypothetical protein